MEPNATVLCGNETTMSLTMCFNDGHRIAIVAYSVFMLVSAIANTTVLINILRNRRVRRCSNNLMFMHLAIADLLVTFVMMPMEIGWNVTVMWTAGDLACRILSFFRIFGLFLSSFVVVCISLDRCFAISSPMASAVNATHRAKTMMIVSWVLATICSSPQGITVNGSSEGCGQPNIMLTHISSHLSNSSNSPMCRHYKEIKVPKPCIRWPGCIKQK